MASLGIACCDLVKMDIEGAEVMALRGMRSLLDGESPPPVLYESNGHTLSFFNESPVSLRRAFAQTGYRCLQIEAGSLIPLALDSLQPECNVDCLAVPYGRSLDEASVWPLRSEMTFDDVVHRSVTMSEHPHEHCRAHIGRALATADAALLTDHRIVDALDELARDPVKQVRDSVYWYRDKRRSDELEGAADVMLRGYTVQSHIPLIGPLIAWLRRNLTSHLRGPYIDPTLERQVGFNRRTVRLMEQLNEEVTGQVSDLRVPIQDTVQDREELMERVVQLEMRLRMFETRFGEVESSDQVNDAQDV